MMEGKREIDVVQQSGVALAIVLWFTAGMSLLVAGLVYNARMDTRMAQVHVARAKVAAAGDGAISLMMADVINGNLGEHSATVIPEQRYSLGDTNVQVRLLPSNGLLNINQADQKTLAALFFLATDMDSAEARSLAANVIKWRKSSPRPGVRVMLRREIKELEDLMQVDGMTRSYFDAVREYISAGSKGGGATDWAIASELLRRVLEQVDPQKAKVMSARRTRAVERRAGGQASSFSRARSYRVDAFMEYGGRVWLRRRWIELQPGRSSALPWRVARTEAPRVVRSGIGKT